MGLANFFFLWSVSVLLPHELPWLVQTPGLANLVWPYLIHEPCWPSKTWPNQPGITDAWDLRLLVMSSSSPAARRWAQNRDRLLPGLNLSCWAHAGLSRSILFLILPGLMTGPEMNAG